MTKNNISHLEREIINLPKSFLVIGLIIVTLSGVIFLAVSGLIKYRDFYTSDIALTASGSNDLLAKNIPDGIMRTLSKNKRVNIQLFENGFPILIPAYVKSANSNSATFGVSRKIKVSHYFSSKNEYLNSKLSFWEEDRSLMERIFKSNTDLISRNR